MGDGGGGGGIRAFVKSAEDMFSDENLAAFIARSVAQRRWDLAK